MIRIGNEYLEYDGMPEVVRQIKTADTIDSAGDFSYSFSVPKTNNNVRVLKIGINRTDTLVPYRINCTIEDSGTVIYIGYLRIEGMKAEIELSFFSGNSEWFADIEGKFMYNLDLSAYKLPLVNTDPNPIIPATWTETEGLVYPLIDRGELRNWSTNLFSLSKFTHPMMYVKNVLPAIFQESGYKIQGELLSESRYINAVAGADSGITLSPSIRKSRELFVGKTSQLIDTTAQLVTFTDTSYPYFVGEKAQFSLSRFTASEDMDVTLFVNLTLDASVDYTIELRQNGSTVGSVVSTGSTISTYVNDGGGNAIDMDEGDYLEVFMYLDTGTVNIISGDMAIELVRFNAEYPQFLFGEMKQLDFVRSLFYMFNVVASFDPYTRTITMNLFKNLTDAQQDLSEYIEDLELNFTEPLDNFAKNNIFQYDPSEGEDITEYNELELTPYGGGNISPVNEFLSGTTNFDVQFASSYSYFNEKLQGNVMDLGIWEFSEASTFSIISVSDSGLAGRALFETSEPHGLSQFDYVDITDTNTGQYVGVGIVTSTPSDTTFTVQGVLFVLAGSVGFSGSVTALSTSTSFTGKVFIMINIPNMLVSDFSNSSQIYLSGTYYDRIAYAYFVKPDSGLPIDDYRESLAFSNPVINGFTGITLIDSYYSRTKAYLDNPAKIRARMRMPYHVFNNLDLTKSIRLKTTEFNSLCFSQKIIGYNPCEIELIQL